MLEEIIELIKEKRPKLSKSSITTYASLLKNIYVKSFGIDKFNIKLFDKSDIVIKTLLETCFKTRKTILSALYIITENEDYKDLMLKDINDYNTEINKQEKDDKQIDSWVTEKEIQDIYKDLVKEANYCYKKSKLSMTDLQTIQMFIIMSLLGGVLIPPRRSKDFVDFKIKNINKSTDNYLEGDKLFFNSYKTNKTYGQQALTIPKELVKILKKWININPTDYLLFDSKENKLTAVKLNQRLNKIFDGKKVGVNQMRHTFLTEKFKDTIDTNKKLKNTFKDMGSSVAQFETYIKK